VATDGVRADRTGKSALVLNSRHGYDDVAAKSALPLLPVAGDLDHRAVVISFRMLRDGAVHLLYTG